MKKVDVLLVGPGSLLSSEFFVIKKCEEVRIMPFFLSHFPDPLRSLVLRATADAFRMMDEMKEIETKVFNETTFYTFVSTKNPAHLKGNGFFPSKIDHANKLMLASRGPKYRWKK